MPEPIQLQQLAFETEAEMIGSRDVPALVETVEENERDFPNWTYLTLLNSKGRIIGAVRYKQNENIVEVGRLMIHPDYRRRGLAQLLMTEVDKVCSNYVRELYTCTKSWSNIKLYEKLGYAAFKEVKEKNGLSFLYMRKG